MTTSEERARVLVAKINETREYLMESADRLSRLIEQLRQESQRLDKPGE